MLAVVLSSGQIPSAGVDITTDPGKLFSYGTKNDSFPTLKIEGYPNRNSIQYGNFDIISPGFRGFLTYIQ